MASLAVPGAGARLCDEVGVEVVVVPEDEAAGVAGSKTSTQCRPSSASTMGCAPSEVQGICSRSCASLASRTWIWLRLSTDSSADT